MGFLPPLPRIKTLLIQEIRLDLSFEQAAARFADIPGTVLLLSGSDLDCARYNCLALYPWLSLEGSGRKQTLKIEQRDGQSISHTFDCEPFDLLQALLARFSLGDIDSNLPVAAGLFGYFAYDLKDEIENLPRTCVDTFLPELSLFAPSVLLVEDRTRGKTYLSSPLFDCAHGQRWVQERKEMFFVQLKQPWKSKAFSIDPQGLISSFTKDEYIKAVSRIIEYLEAGDIYQANLSQRFETKFTGDVYSLFLELFNKNPASFFSFIHCKDHDVVSTSPERFIQLRGKKVETRPIKGTIARGTTRKADRENSRALSESSKDDAELTMIVDLMRNDISRVTLAGSVDVTQHKRLEPYENVFHLVSVVTGTLEPDKTAVDLLHATFPGGSITGCPKIRAMEIIDELEPVKRHVYTGSIGYISFHNTMDLSIAIRTATIHENQLVFSVGGGIVADSDPEKEYQETLDKGKTLMDTLLNASFDPGTRHLTTWVNGKILNQTRARVPAASKAFQYGAGLFETIRVENGTPLRLNAHVKRMENAWKNLFDIPVPNITWDKVITLLVRDNNLEDQVCAVKLVIAEDGRPGHPVFTAAFIRPYVHRLALLNKKGLDLKVFPNSRKTFLADHKTLNYFYYERAGKYARAQGCDEALILNSDMSVSETNTCNIFAIQGSTLVCPESCHVLPGVTFGAVSQAWLARGYKIRYEKMTPEQLAAYPNVMVANALMGVVRVDHINGTRIAQDPGLCKMLNAFLTNQSS
ncbi:MAG: aminodeoxychorismate synthase component I [Desulfobacter sp.]|nr:aminodeoxychorismate synthase component I [Desulfobacter sp.]